MSTGARVAAAVASGYLLGRRRKIKLAIMVGGLLAGRRIATSPQGLLKQANEYIEANPELAKISESVRTTLLDSARQAAVGTASGGIERLSDAIHDRTDKLNAVTESGSRAESEATEDEPVEDERAEGERAEDERAEGEPVDEEPADSATEQSPKRSGGSGRTATKSAAKKSTAKKSAATKSTAQKPAAKKASSAQSSRRTSSGGKQSGTAKKASSSRQTSTRNRG